MGSGPANITLFLDNHLADTIAAKRAELARNIAKVRENIAELVDMEAHAALSDGTFPTHPTLASVPGVVPRPTTAPPAGAGPPVQHDEGMGTS